MDDVVREERMNASVQDIALAETTAPAAPSPLWLALDQGGHASRAIVFDAQGHEVMQAYAPITTRHIDEQRVEHDAAEIRDSLHTVIADVANSLGKDLSRIQAAGLATQRSSIVCWDARDGTALSPVLSWQDRRNAALTDSLNPQREVIQSLTGLVLSPHYGASKLRWCLDELPAVKLALRQGQLQCGPLASYLLHALLDEHPHVVDPANASRTQLWSPASGEWSSQLLQWFGVPREVLPQPVATHHRYGSLRVGDHPVPLIVCTGDQAAVPFAMGELDSNAIYLNIGTGAFALAPMQHDIANAAPLLRSVLYSDSTHIQFALEGTVNGAGSALSWLGERIALDVQRALPLLRRSQVPPRVPLFINGVGGVGSPYWLPQVTSTFISDEDHDDLTALIAVVESIAFLIVDNVVLMRKHLPQLDCIVAGGGVSVCPYLCECIASLSGLPVTSIQEPELTAKGLAWLIADRPPQWQRIAATIRHAVVTDLALEARYHQWQQRMQYLCMQAR